MQIYGELHRFIPVLAHYRGYRVAELPVNHRPREHGRSRYGMERYVRGFLDLLTVTFMGRYRHRPLHLFGGVGLLLGAAGTLVLVYLTVLKLTGEAIGHRPLLTLGVLLVVVGVQLLSLGLVSELIASHHEERTGGGRDDRAARGRDPALTLTRPLLRNVRARLPAERAGDLLPSRRRSRGGRAARERVGAAAAQVVARHRGRRAGSRSPRRDSCSAAGGSLRRPDRGLSRPFRRACRQADRARQAGDLQSARVAPRNPRRGPRAFRAGSAPARFLRRVDRIALRRADLVVADTEQNARHLRRSSRELPRRTAGGLLRRRRGRLFRPGWQPPGKFRRAVRRQADPAARARDDSRGRAARAGGPVPHRRQRPARRAPARRGRRTSSGSSGSTTSGSRTRSSARGARSASSGRPRRRAA